MAAGTATPGERPLRTLLIDNYDSFTYNLVHQIAATAGQPPVVVPNDWGGWSADVLDAYDAVVLSPGPGDPRTPSDFGICAEAIRIATERRIPLFGICLGHQGLAHAFGGRVGRAPEPRHGRPSPVTHDGTGTFRGLVSPVEVIRYHSLMVDELPPDLVVTARAADDGVIMGLRHRELPLWGVQFHPESIGTVDGTRMMANFMALVRAEPRRAATASADRRAQTHPPAWPPARPEPRDVISRSLPLRHDPARLFTELFGDAPRAVWLDGNRPGDARSRFSIMGGGSDLVAAVADVHEGTVTLRGGGGTGGGDGDRGRPRVVRSGFFDWLEAELAGTTTRATGLPFALGWVGALGYELRAECGSPHGRRASTPEAMLIRLDRALLIDLEEERIHLLAFRDDGGAEWVDRIAAGIAGLDRIPPRPPGPIGDLALTARHGGEEYLRLIAEAQEEIGAGETYEACLTNAVRGTGAVDPLSAYLALRAQNPAPFGAFLRVDGVSVLSTSPERFLRITAGGEVESSPIKGTRPRGATRAEDDRIRAELAEAEKDRAENLMIVDLVRHDLGRTAELGSVHVDALFRIESYATVHQLVSTVRSRLADSPVACVRAAFPPGSMTGAPKIRTMSILDRLEAGPRGLYSGALGFFSFDGAVDLSVVIRTLVVGPDGVDYGVGGAIVALSDPEDEYAETVVKARPLLRLIGAEFPAAGC